MFNNLIVAYLFLGGMGAGACAVLSVLSIVLLRSKSRTFGTRALASIPCRRLFGFGFLLAAAVCAVGAFCLLADMRRPDEVLVLLVSPTFTVVSVGAYVLAATILCAVVSGLAWLGVFKIRRTTLRLIATVQVVLALAVMTYTALLLMTFWSVPFFSTPLIIALFLASSLSCGTAAVVLFAIVTRVWENFAVSMRRLALADAVIIAVEALVLTAFVLVSCQVAPESAARLIGGELAVAFWAGLVAAGLAVPFVLYVAECAVPAARVNPLLPAVLVLVGGFVLRWCVVTAA